MIDVQEYPAGSKLDMVCAKVYAELMGWEKREYFAVIYYYAPDNSGRHFVVAKPSDSYTRGLGYWQPSTDIASAWKLVEAMDKPLWIFSLHREKHYHAIFTSVRGQQGAGMARAASLAITRAFLLAHGVTEIGSI